VRRLTRKSQAQTPTRPICARDCRFGRTRKQFLFTRLDARAGGPTPAGAAARAATTADEYFGRDRYKATAITQQMLRRIRSQSIGVR